ncbi:MAG: T9SS type A sorting domain-containing protein [Saprospiraceae bacterium]
MNKLFCLLLFSLFFQFTIQAQSFCDFTVSSVNDCTVCFTSTNAIPGIAHIWNFGDGSAPVITVDATVCHTYATPGGNFPVSHFHADLECNDNISVNCTAPCPASVDVEFCYDLTPFSCNPCVTGTGFFCPVVTVNGVSTQVDFLNDYTVVWQSFPGHPNNSPFSSCLTYDQAEELDAINNGTPNTYSGIVFGPNNCQYPFSITIQEEDVSCGECDDAFDVSITINNCDDPNDCDPCTEGGTLCVVSNGAVPSGEVDIRLNFNNGAPAIILPSGTSCYNFGAEIENIGSINIYNKENHCQYWLPVVVECEKAACPELDFDITADTGCPPDLFCPICLTGGKVCVSFNGGPIPGFALFNFEGGVFIPAEDGCLQLTADLAESLISITVSVHGCEYVVPVAFSDPNCSPLFDDEGGVEMKKRLMEFEVYPNPAHQVLQISNPSENTFNGVLQSIDGRAMKAFQLNAYETEVVNTSNFAKGIYFLKIMDPISKEIIRTEKILITP